MPAGYYAGPDDPLVSADFGGWWRRGFTLLAATWQQLALVQLIWVVPFLIFMLATASSDTFTYSTTANYDDFDVRSELVEPLLLVTPALIIIGLLSGIVQLATLDLLVQRATGRPMSIGAALRTGLRRVLPLIGWEILAGLLVVVGLVFCLLPGFYVLTVVLVLPVIILLERGQGIGRAFQLFHADFGAALARIVTIIALYFGFAVVEMIFSAVLAPTEDPSTAINVLMAIVSAAFSVATTVVVSPLLLTAYADMRARREPFSTAYLSA